MTSHRDETLTRSITKSIVNHLVNITLSSTQCLVNTMSRQHTSLINAALINTTLSSTQCLINKTFSSTQCNGSHNKTAESGVNFDALWEIMTPMSRARIIGILVKAITLYEKKDTVTAVLTDLCRMTTRPMEIMPRGSSERIQPNACLQVMRWRRRYECQRRQI